MGAAPERFRAGQDGCGANALGVGGLPRNSADAGELLLRQNSPKEPPRSARRRPDNWVAKRSPRSAECQINDTQARYHPVVPHLSISDSCRSQRSIALGCTLAMALFLLWVVPTPSSALAASSPGGAVAAAWPASWNIYRFQDGTQISDVNADQNPNTLDLASGTCAACTGPDPTVQYASDGTTAFFRVRLATNIADNTKGGLVDGAFLTQIAVGGVVKAVVGVDGKSSSADYVYVANSIGGTVTTVYQYPFDSSGGQSSAGMRVVAAGDGSGQYFLDYQVPLSAITTVSGGDIGSSTPIKLYYGSSAAANLATINKDFMAGDVGVAVFTNLATVSFAPASLSLSSSATSLSGPNPPVANGSSFYTVTVTATNSGGGDLSSITATIPYPAGVTVSSPSTATGSISGSPLLWNIGTLLPGASATATFVASVTPSSGNVGSNVTLVSAQSGTGTDAPVGASRTASASAITVGPVAPGSSTVSFNSAGGSGVPAQTVTNGGLATAPAAPARAGYSFDGWFTAATGGSLWDFATGTISADTTLYAQWTAVGTTNSLAWTGVAFFAELQAALIFILLGGGAILINRRRRRAS